MTSNRLIIIAGTALLLLAACGKSHPRSGVVLTLPTDAGPRPALASSRQLTSLSPAEVRTLCEYFVAVAGGPPVECPDGTTVSGPSSVDDCTSGFALPTGCTATVGYLESCIEAIGADPCTGFTAPACAPPPGCAG